MARQLGFNIRLFYGARDISADASDVNVEASADTVDVTNFNSGGYKENQSTLKSLTATFNVFYQSGVGTIGAQLEALYGLTEILTLDINEANAIGDTVVVMPTAILEKLQEPIKVNDVIKMNASLKGSGAMAVGFKMHVLGAETTNGTSTSVDNAVSSASGGRFTVHTTAINATSIAHKIQDSPDNSTFTDLSGAALTVTAVGAQTIEVTGTVARYTRDKRTITGTSETYVSAFARY